MYLKEGDIGKAESEEVVPVKTETEVVSQAGFTGRSPGSGFLAPASGCQDWVSGLGANCREPMVGQPQGELYLR